jgi:uncharacterized protein (TIGR03663 family)
MSPRRRAGLLFALAVTVAAALRFPDLAARPMHADEAIHADKLATLLEGGGYAYDPSEYHGPTLYYLSVVSAVLRGQRTLAALDEATLRGVTAALGVALVAAHAAAVPFLGAAGALAAAALVALSPAMVYYSRYYIHEVPLVLFSFGALLAACAYLRRPSRAAALAAGTSAGLMLATKETAVLALASMVVAFGATLRADGGSPAERRGSPAVRPGDLALGAAAMLAVAVVLFSSFLRHPAGVADAGRAFAFYVERAGANPWHVHPWHFYLGLLARFPSTGVPFFTEAVVLVLAAGGAAAAWAGDGAGADRRVLRFLSVYTLALIVVYAAIPYKTPWCLIGFLHGLVLLAGAGAVAIVRALRGRSARAAAAALLAAAAVDLGGQAWRASFRHAADPRNPYVYAHTGRDVFLIAERLKALARAHPDGLAMPLQVVSRENLWPLPWYLRSLTRVEWWNGVSDEARVAPVVVITPDMEAALVRRLYEVPPPGQRELYVSIFDRGVELRPRVELRGYAANSLWEETMRETSFSVDSSPAVAGAGAR